MAGRPHGSTGTAPTAGGDVVAPVRGRPQPDPSGDVGSLYRALVEHAREAVTIVDASGVVVYHNPSMGRVVGRPPEWFEGRSPLELMPPEDAARAVRVLQQLAGKPGAQLPGEFRLRHSDGSWRRVEGVATNLLHDPVVRGIVLNYRDVTDERKHEHTLRDIERRRQSLLEEIINAEGEQRSRIAGELHDDTIQVMIASLVELDRSERHLRGGDMEAALGAIAKARATLAEATDRTRRLTIELRPQLLEAAGLGPAIRDLADALHRDRERRRARLCRRAAAVAHVEEHGHRHRPRADPRARRQLRRDVGSGRGHHRGVLAAAAVQMTFGDGDGLVGRSNMSV